MELSAVTLRDEGMIGHDDGVVQVRRVVDDPQSRPGAQSLHVTLDQGLAFEVLPDRGLDLGPAWFAGRPVAWRGPLAARRPHPEPLGWLGGFSGLLVTCGLDHIGPPARDRGLHGSHRDTPARDVVVERVRDGERLGVRISGVIDSVEMFGRLVRMHRVIESYTGEAAVTVRDRIVNEGWNPAPAPVLYHVNLGAPLVAPGTEVNVNAGQSVVREEVAAIPDWKVYPEPRAETVESVWEHSAFPEEGRAEVRSPSGLTATLTWNTGVLPRLVQWVYPARGRYALGIEPGNAPIWGTAWEGDDEGAPVLEPGEETQTGIRIEFAQR